MPVQRCIIMDISGLIPDRMNLNQAKEKEENIIVAFKVDINVIPMMFFVRVTKSCDACFCAIVLA